MQNETYLIIQTSIMEGRNGNKALSNRSPALRTIRRVTPFALFSPLPVERVQFPAFRIASDVQKLLFRT